LALIDAHPEMRAAELARRQGLQKAHFKGRVRQLKELGLTESLRVGYRLSPRGAKVLAAAPDACKPHTD
jgi:DNA-binding IclR family transcriptional regulator